LFLFVYVFDILTAALFLHFIYFLFLNFSPSKLYQLCMLLTLDADDVIFIIILHCDCADCIIMVKMENELLRCHLQVMVKIG